VAGARLLYQRFLRFQAFLSFVFGGKDISFQPFLISGGMLENYMSHVLPITNIPTEQTEKYYKYI